MDLSFYLALFLIIHFLLSFLLSPPEQCCCSVRISCPSSPEELEKLQWYVANMLTLFLKKKPLLTFNHHTH